MDLQVKAPCYEKTQTGLQGFRRSALKKAAHPASYAVAGMRCGATVSSKPSCPGSCHDHSGDWPDTLHISCFLMCRLGAQKTVVLSRVCFRHPPHPGSNRDTASVAWQRCPAVTPAVCQGKRPNSHHLPSLRRLRAGHSFPSATSLPPHHAIRHPSIGTLFCSLRALRQLQNG